MIASTKNSNRFFIESLEELERIIDASSGDTLFLDVESTSGNPKADGLSTYQGSRIVGYAFSVELDGPIYYVSLRHRDIWAHNLDGPSHARLMRRLFAKHKRWVNHNVKFDAHFCAMELDVYDELDKWFYTGDWYCTTVAAKLVDSDRMSFELKKLGEDWLGIKPDLRDEVKAYLKSKKSKDFGDVPSTLLGEYAMEDINLNRRLFTYVDQRIPDSARRLHETERKLTAVLFDMERRGVKIDRRKLLTEKARAITKIIELESELAELTGYEFTNSSKHLSHVILTVFGLPVVAYTEKSTKMPDGSTLKTSGGPSFDAEALELYQALPQVVNNVKFARFFEVLSEYRSEAQFFSLYLAGWEKHLDANDRLHANYNQIIRTGRMSCSDPNMQQLDKRAKALVIPDHDEEFCSRDASQIEFRFMAHYMADPAIGDTSAADAYNSDPKTDYHTFVSKLVEIDRSPAKTVNFMKAYGGGKGKMKSALRQQKSIIAAIKAQVDQAIADGRMEENLRIAAYETLIDQRAAHIIETYEARLPGIKTAANLAAKICKARGFVVNAYGRVRRLPPQAAHISFNTVMQGGAMDFIKTRMVAASPRWNTVLDAAGIALLLNVHDELVWSGPRGVFTPEVCVWLEDILMEQDPVKLRVPILWSGGVSAENWAKA